MRVFPSIYIQATTRLTTLAGIQLTPYLPAGGSSVSICNVNRLSLPANVTSPSYPSSYGNNRNCQVTLAIYLPNCTFCKKYDKIGLSQDTCTHHLCLMLRNTLKVFWSIHSVIQYIDLSVAYSCYLYVCTRGGERATLLIWSYSYSWSDVMERVSTHSKFMCQ